MKKRRKKKFYAAFLKNIDYDRQNNAHLKTFMGFPGSTVVKNPSANAGNVGSIPVPGRPPLEEEVAAHSCILICKSPWAEEPGRLQSMGSQRVGYNLETEQQQKMFTF